MTVFYVTTNQPGYLPEGEPIGCETLDDARACLASEIRDTGCLYGGDESEAADALARAETAMPGESIMVIGYAHTITESDEAF